MRAALWVLAANVACRAMLAQHRAGGAHAGELDLLDQRVLARRGVMVAGFRVAGTRAHPPDLSSGMAIGLLVFSSARRILRLRH